MKHKSSTHKKNKRRMGVEFCPLTRSVLPPVPAGPLSPPFPPPPPGSLSLSIPPSLAFSLHPLSERHAEAVGSLRRVWGSARAVRGCYLGLLQQTGSSSPKGRGESRESQSHAQYSTARQEPDLHSS